jgi:hypothetical protein
MRVNDQVMRYLTVRVDEERRRAEKLKARRARKAAKRPFSGGGALVGGRGVAPVSAGEESEADRARVFP